MMRGEGGVKKANIKRASKDGVRYYIFIDENTTTVSLRKFRSGAGGGWGDGGAR